MYLVLFLVDLLYSKKLLQNFEENVFFMISVTWSVNFQTFSLFYLSLNSVCLLSIRQRREFLAKI